MVQKLSKDMPPIIMITLNRFYYDRTTQSRKKRIDPVALSYSISISKEFICEDAKQELSPEATEEQPEVAYDLYAIIIHSGVTAHSGHYYTIAKDDVNSTDKAKWKSFNDSMVSEVDEDFIMSISMKMKYDTPYVLFYRQREKPKTENGQSETGEPIVANPEQIVLEPVAVDTNPEEEIVATTKNTRVVNPPKRIVDSSGKLNIPETLKKFIETDNESYLKEKEFISLKGKNQYSSKDFNFALLKELQKHLMKANDKGFDEARTMGPGGFGGYSNNNFFGGDGGV
mmetsp:Transcript_17291/g.20041  ORF Transcript_17291/g.20041 Transcript_17291/m.20041 type:complete len:285 (-) Transcript_17291:48-902(-)|eukprot:CAMPEP_0168349978 /NCGR_PEP_ID=MMETSP0213-20121227/20803_1 /TAXON_ID=151035 /ORGANISM="Euplotes harpa, Strain FSP1.4" /LENGTH=284 /DNA_ID=CAMNT_0008360153 /DNA_START=1174 /DNA_END=2028 /DNA_ORIENTATION=+